MITCANCPREALFTYAVTETYLIHYCHYHLPRFLASQKNAGLLGLQAPAPVVEAPVEVEEPVKVSKSKKSAPVVEEPTVEEVPTEDAPKEE